MNISLQLGDTRIDLESHQVFRPQGTVRLSATESRLLAYMAAHSPRVLSREELLREVWGYADGLVTRAEHHTVTRLRRKIESDPSKPVHLVSVYGQGYRLNLDSNHGRPRRAGFFGRNSELKDIARSLERPGITTLFGPAGVGKTRLAHEVVNAGRLRVWACNLQAVHDESGLRAAMAPGVPNRSCPSEALKRDNQVLVLDNADGLMHLLATMLPEWCTAAPNLRVLLTTSVAIKIPNERAFHIDPLPTAGNEGDPRFALFLDTTRRLGIELPPTSHADVHALIRDTDGLPLAIQLIASQCHVHSPAQLRQHHAARQGPADALHSSLETSWNLLDESERQALTALSVFRSEFHWTAASEVTGVHAQVLQNLFRHSLVQRRAGPHTITFRLLTSVRSFARARLTAPHQTRLNARHLAFFSRADPCPEANYLLDHLAAIGPKPSDPRVHGAVLQALRIYLEVGPYHDGIRLATHALTHGAVTATAARIALLKAQLLHQEGDSEQAFAISTALEAQRSSPDIRALACALQANISLKTGQSAQRHVDRGWRHLGASKSPGTRGDLYAVQAVIHKTLGENEAALAQLRLALTRYEEAKNPRLCGMVLGRMGNVMTHLANYTEAHKRYERALSHHRSLGNLRNEALVRCNLGVLCQRQGRFEDALDHYRKTLTQARAMGDLRLEALALTNLGAVESTIGNFTAAKQSYEFARALHIRVGNVRLEGVVNDHLGNMLRVFGATDGADFATKQAVRLLRKSGRTLDLSGALGNRAHLLIVQGDTAGALDCAREALQLVGELGDPHIRSVLTGTYGLCLAHTGDPTCNDICAEAVTLARRVVPDKHQFAHTLLCRAEALWLTDHAHRARGFLQEALLLGLRPGSMINVELDALRTRLRVGRT